MGLFSSGINKDIASRFDPVNTGFGSNVNDFGSQAGGSSDRSANQWDAQGALYADIGDKLNSGYFDTPGRAARAANLHPEFGNWWESLRGGAGTSALKDSRGNNVTDFSTIANEGMMTPEQMYAMRERPASQARSATSSFMEALRRGGLSGWGGGGAAGALAGQKNLLSSLRSGNLEANASIADMTNQQRQWGYGQMQGAESNMEAARRADDAERAAAWSTGSAGHHAGLGDYLAYMQADPRGSALDWSKQATNNIGGQTSALSGWGGNIAAQTGTAKEAPKFGQIMQGVGSLAGAALGTGGIAGLMRTGG